MITVTFCCGLMRTSDDMNDELFVNIVDSIEHVVTARWLREAGALHDGVVRQLTEVASEHDD